MVSFSLDITVDGVAQAVTDGTLDKDVAAALDEACKTIGDQAVGDIHQTLNARIQHPTPYYETQIIRQELAEGTVVHDRSIVYGPWLEGTSARNATSSFKGYHAFEEARVKVRERVKEVTDQLIGDAIRRNE